MKRKVMAILAVALGTGLVSACNDGNHAAAMQSAPAAPTVQMLDTAQVLSAARQATETGTPFAVDGGLLVLNDTSETSEPLAVNTM